MGGIKPITDRANDPVIASIIFEKKKYELTKAGVIFVCFEKGSYFPGDDPMKKTETKRVMHRDSPRRRAIQDAFQKASHCEYFD